MSDFKLRHTVNHHVRLAIFLFVLALLNIVFDLGWGLIITLYVASFGLGTYLAFRASQKTPVVESNATPTTPTGGYGGPIGLV